MAGLRLATLKTTKDQTAVTKTWLKEDVLEGVVFLNHFPCKMEGQPVTSYNGPNPETTTRYIQRFSGCSKNMFDSSIGIRVDWNSDPHHNLFTLQRSKHLFQVVILLFCCICGVLPHTPSVCQLRVYIIRAIPINKILFLPSTFHKVLYNVFS